MIIDEKEEETLEESIEEDLEELEEAIENKDSEKLNDIVEQMYPIDVAIALEEYEDEEIKYLMENMDDEQLATIVEQADEELQVRMINIIDVRRIMKMFEYMSKDDIVDILGELQVNKRKEIIKYMKSGDRKIIETLLGYGKNTAGGLMTTEYIAVNMNWTVNEVIQKIKEIAPKTEVIDTIFVVNNRRELVGTVDLRDILVTPYEDKMDDIINDNVISVYPDTDQEEVSLLVSKYDLNVMPVVSRKNSLLGVITLDDIIDVINDEHTEDMLHMGGANAEESIYSKVSESIRMRLPWLTVNLATAFLASFTVSLFEGTIAQVTALAAAMPIVTGMGGNAGSQELSIIIRSIALDEVELKDSLPLVIKQILIGIFNGAVIGILAGIILYFMYGNMYLGLIIFASMIANLVLAGIVGVLTPLILKALKIDPALASAIFLTTATDVFGFFIFLGLASIILPKLL
ncbi:MAG: magnesium transporter [Tissierellia bacterium]|nr:magnesium transporter [Tissierellia bacterium]